jgi:hypothetical protein
MSVARLRFYDDDNSRSGLCILPLMFREVSKNQRAISVLVRVMRDISARVVRCGFKLIVFANVRELTGFAIRTRRAALLPIELVERFLLITAWTDSVDRISYSDNRR